MVCSDQERSSNFIEILILSWVSLDFLMFSGFVFTALSSNLRNIPPWSSEIRLCNIEAGLLQVKLSSAWHWNEDYDSYEPCSTVHVVRRMRCSGESFTRSFSSRWPSVEWSQRRRSHVGWFDLVHNLTNPLYGSCQVQRRLCCFILQIWYNCRHSIKIDVLSQDLHRNKPVFTDIRQLLVPLKVDFCTLMQSSKTRLRYSEMLKTNISRIKSSLIAVQYF